MERWMIKIIITHMKDFDKSESLISKFKKEKEITTGTKEVHNFYAYKIGQVKNVSKLDKFSISDPECETYLQNSEYYISDASVCFSERSLELFFERKYTTDELQHAIQNYTTDGDKYIGMYKSKATTNKQKLKSRASISDNQAYGCCLALSYYTGHQSERISRTCTVIIKLFVQDKIGAINRTQQFEQMRCIGHWLFKALSYIRLYWGQVTRCVQLSQQQQKFYAQGSIFTWLQFSSSSYGKVTPYFLKRNTRFKIYSLTGRCIQQFSNYQGEATQSEVLFKPFTHFLVTKKQVDGPITFIYMRQVFIGQTKKNILWVDDNIFDPQWENKLIMERAIIMDPTISIIPKVSTECALAFLNSSLGKGRRKDEFRVVTDMTRDNESPSSNAGARFLKRCQELNHKYMYMVFTGNKERAEEVLKQLNVQKKDVAVTHYTHQALSFISFA